MTTSLTDHHLLRVGAIALGLTIAIGVLSPLLSDDGGVAWARYVVGVVLALALWFGLAMGSLGASKGRGRVGPSARQYLAGAVVTVVLGGAMVIMMDTLAAWGVGTVVAIAASGIAGFQNSEEKK